MEIGPYAHPDPGIGAVVGQNGSGDQNSTLTKTVGLPTAAQNPDRRTPEDDAHRRGTARDGGERTAAPSLSEMGRC